MHCYTLPEVVRRNADRHPDAEALRFGERSLTWSELAGASEALARVLAAGGVRRGDRVGVLLRKSAEIGISVHGAMRAGAAYVPLNPAAAPAEIAYVLEHCGIRHLVTDESQARTVAAALGSGAQLSQVVGLESDVGVETASWDEVEAEAGATAPEPRIIGDDLAYIIYTSGSTGRPKGIMHSHQSCLGFCRWARDVYGLERRDVLTNQSPLHFDMSIFDLFAGALVGAATVIVSEAHMKMPASYAALLAEESISVFFTVPFALTQLLTRGALERHDLGALRWIVSGGENMPTKHVAALMRLLPDCRFSNMYGPAETNGCTYYNIDAIENEEDQIPIGGAAPGMECVVLDDDGAPVAPGGYGELLVRGPSLMLGYWSALELNREAFLRREREGGSEEVYYRTGDLVEVLPVDGFRFAGRLDRQVKVRGYRIELDAIEHALLAQSEVENAAAFAVDGSDGVRTIACAVEGRAGSQLSPEQVRTHLRTLLPTYAMPAVIEIVAALPRLQSGKVDYLELSGRGEARR